MGGGGGVRLGCNEYAMKTKKGNKYKKNARVEVTAKHR
jgi:hypothetical protein